MCLESQISPPNHKHRTFTTPIMDSSTPINTTDDAVKHGIIGRSTDSDKKMFRLVEDFCFSQKPPMAFKKEVYVKGETTRDSGVSYSFVCACGKQPRKGKAKGSQAADKAAAKKKSQDEATAGTATAALRSSSEAAEDEDEGEEGCDEVRKNISKTCTVDASDNNFCSMRERHL